MKRIIVALDLPDIVGEHSILSVASRLDPEYCLVKIGFQGFMAGGPSLISSLKEMGFEVFLDLKFKDIPNTICCAVEEAIKMGVWGVTIHLDSGYEAVHEAVKIARDSDLKLFGVTVLTSMDDNDLFCLGIKRSVISQVSYLADLAVVAGISGIVASAKEVHSLREGVLKKGELIICPGIRPMISTDFGDQKRVSTPENAIKVGADYLVIGRPIVGTDDPGKELMRINKAISNI